MCVCDKARTTCIAAAELELHPVAANRAADKKQDLQTALKRPRSTISQSPGSVKSGNAWAPYNGQLGAPMSRCKQQLLHQPGKFQDASFRQCTLPAHNTHTQAETRSNSSSPSPPEFMPSHISPTAALTAFHRPGSVHSSGSSTPPDKENEASQRHTQAPLNVSERQRTKLPLGHRPASRLPYPPHVQPVQGRKSFADRLLSTITSDGHAEGTEDLDHADPKLQPSMAAFVRTAENSLPTRTTSRKQHWQMYSMSLLNGLLI